jgi:hypothetical protein
VRNKECDVEVLQYNLKSKFSSTGVDDGHEPSTLSPLTVLSNTDLIDDLGPLLTSESANLHQPSNY